MINKLKKVLPTSDGWNLAKDSLPEPDIEVATITIGGQRVILKCTPQNTRAEFEDGKWCIAWYVPVKSKGKRQGEAHHFNKITHWMYLPSVPAHLVEV